MRKLALYLTKKVGGQARIEIIEDLLQTAKCRPETVWVGSAAFIGEIREKVERARCIVLAEEEGTEEMVICRYQSCEKVCQRILFFCRKRGGAALVSQTNRQKWLVMTADCTVSQMLAFSVTLAYLLGQKGRTLYLNLSECSGMGELFLMDPGTDLSDMILELRQDEGVLLEAFTRRLEQVDCILPPDNPMVLHEIREQDVEKILRKVQETDLYEYVVLAIGSSCCGCDLFFQRASRLLHLTREGETFPESRQAWLRLIRTCRQEPSVSVSQISLPPVSAENGGIHLLYDWAKSPLGQLAREYLNREGEETDGAVAGDPKPDFE